MVSSVKNKHCKTCKTLCSCHKTACGKKMIFRCKCRLSSFTYRTLLVSFLSLNGTDSVSYQTSGGGGCTRLFTWEETQNQNQEGPRPGRVSTAERLPWGLDTVRGRHTAITLHHMKSSFPKRNKSILTVFRKIHVLDRNGILQYI